MTNAKHNYQKADERPIKGEATWLTGLPPVAVDCFGQLAAMSVRASDFTRTSVAEDEVVDVLEEMAGGGALTLLPPKLHTCKS